MASKKISIQEEHILKLILEFLGSRKYYKSSRSLEKETGVTTNSYSENISFFRDLVLDGDWPAVREFGEPLADIPAFEYRKFNFLVSKQEYLEILFEKCEGNLIHDEQTLRDRLLACLQNLERYCTFKEEYNKLYWYLSVPSLYSEPEFCSWSIDSFRMQLFEDMLELLKQFIPIGEQRPAKNNLLLEERLLTLLFKGSLYENCIEFCQKQAMGKTGPSDLALTDIKVDLFRKQSLKSTGNFYSWLHSLSKESFVEPFEELNFEMQLEKQKQNTCRVKAKVKNNSLSRSLTIELKSPTKVLLQKGRDESRKHLRDFPSCEPTYNMRDVSQSFAEFEFAVNGNDRSVFTGGSYQKFMPTNLEVFLQNGKIYPDAPASHMSNELPNKEAESPRKIRRHQQDLVLQQLEEHKQRQRELYEQLEESVSLAKAGGQIKDSKRSEGIPEESKTSLEAVKKSIQNLKLLAESYERPKCDQEDVKNVVNPHKGDVHQLNSAKKREHLVGPSQKDLRPDTISINEVPGRKSSSSTPGSATLPKTPVNTCLPPGLVKLTDGSGAFNTSTPKAERQSFTTPLPASPVTSELKLPRDDLPLRLSQQHKGNLVQERHDRPNMGEQTPKASGAKQFAVRRSLVNTVFQNEDDAKVETDPKVARATLTSNSDAVLDSHSPRVFKANIDPPLKTVETKSVFAKENLMGDFKKSRNQTVFARENSAKGLTETDPKNKGLQNYSTPNNSRVTVGSSSLHDPTRFQNRKTDPSTKMHSPVEERTRLGTAQRTVQSSATPITTADPFQRSNSAPVKFQKSAMLADTQAIRAVAFHPCGNYFAVGTNSKALKICRKETSRHFERDEQQISELEVLCQKTSIHKGSVYCVAFSSDGDIIATGSNDKTIKLLRFNEDHPASLEDQMELCIHNATVRDLTFVHTAAGGHPVLASGGAGGGLIYLSDCFTGQTLSSLQGHAGNVMAVFAGDQAHLLCSGSADKSVRLWDLRMARSIDVIATSSCVTSVCFNYGTTHSLMLASADDSGQCIVYDVGARKSIRSFTPHEMDCRSIRFSPDSQHILTGSYDACVAITSVHYSDSEILSDSYIVGKHRDKVIQCRWHPSEYTFVSSSADKTVVLWEQSKK